MIVQLLDVLMGLTVIYLVLSTIASSVLETFEAGLQKRGQFLEEGIAEILAAVSGLRENQPAVQKPAKGETANEPTDIKKLMQPALAAFYNSPFISSLFRGGYGEDAKKLPSYIPADRFADALFQLAKDKDSVFAKFVDRMEAAIGEDAKQEAEKDLEKVRAQCVRYYNESMERVSGWYQRHARNFLICIGFAIAALGNVDTLQLVRVLSQNESLRDQIVTAAADPAEFHSNLGSSDVLKQLHMVGALGLPLGWTNTDVCAVFQKSCPDDNSGASDTQSTCWFAFLADSRFLSKVLGILLTTFALSFGAPFWFDLLNEIVNLRTSLKPKGKEPDKSMAPSTGPTEDDKKADAVAPGQQPVHA